MVEYSEHDPLESPASRTERSGHQGALLSSGEASRALSPPSTPHEANGSNGDDNMHVRSALHQPSRVASFYGASQPLSANPQAAGPSFLHSTSSRPPVAFYDAPPTHRAEVRHFASKSPVEPLPVAEVLQSSLPELVQASLQEFRNVVDTFRDAEWAATESGKSVTKTFNGYDDPDRSGLWSDWVLYSNLCRALVIPVFPIQPDKSALVLSAHAATLPSSTVVRQLAQFGGVPCPEKVPRMLAMLQVAASATRRFWPDIRCFVREATDYDSTRIVFNATKDSKNRLARAQAVALASNGQPPLLISEVTSRPLITNVPSADALDLAASRT
ncbi:hypothetical protein JCM8097_004316 [Rhodosporidiobolus ruineniae]